MIVTRTRQIGFIDILFGFEEMKENTPPHIHLFLNLKFLIKKLDSPHLFQRREDNIFKIAMFEGEIDEFYLSKDISKATTLDFNNVKFLKYLK